MNDNQIQAPSTGNEERPSGWTHTGYVAPRSTAPHAQQADTRLGANAQGMPVSRDWAESRGRELAMQHAAAQGFDFQTNTQGRIGGYDVDRDPAAWLQAHGLQAINEQGHPVVPSAAQARGLLRAMFDAETRNHGYSGATSLSYRDDSLPPQYALVKGRRI